MKLIKKIDLKNSKVLLGLFALLFMGSVAQTAAILETQYSLDQSGQKAQVISPTTCITATHSRNLIEPFFYGDTGVLTGNQYSYQMFFRIKNICSYDIKVVNPTSYDTPQPTLPSLKNTSVQIMNNLGSPVSLDISNNVQNIRALSELLTCPGCESGATSVHTYPTSPSGNNSISVVNLAAGQSRNISMFVIVDVPDNTSELIRVKLNKLNWFRSDTALSDGIVQDSEITGTSFTSAFSNTTATSYLRAAHSPDYSGMMGDGTKNSTLETGFKVQ